MKIYIVYRHEYDGIDISAIYEKEEYARTVVEELRELHKTEDFDYEEWEVL